jgi:hypothetical protein
MNTLTVYMNETLDTLYRTNYESFRDYSWPMVDNHYRTAAWQMGRVVSVALADGTIIGECYPYGASKLF